MARGGTDMSGPGWLAGCFVTLMIAVAVYCASRLAASRLAASRLGASRLAGSRLRGKSTDVAADGLHVMMGVAMAGMLEPRLAPVPGTIWCAVFAAAAVWFAWQASPAGRRAGRARCTHPAPHAIECAAMVYMLAPIGSWPSARSHGTVMPGMIAAGTAGNPALTVVLALFMLGYALHATDQLATLSRTSQAAAGLAVAAPAAAMPRVALAPRLAAGYKIAMAVTMGYMLVTML